METSKVQYDVQDAIDLGYNLVPLVCRKCGSTEVTFNQYIGDACCDNCGEWQLDLELNSD